MEKRDAMDCQGNTLSYPEKEKRMMAIIRISVLLQRNNGTMEEVGMGIVITTAFLDEEKKRL